MKRPPPKRKSAPGQEGAISKTNYTSNDAEAGAVVKIEASADRVNVLHGRIANALKQSLDDAIEIGTILVTVKKELAHGEFGAWLIDNVRFSDRTARRYMKLFDNRHRLKTASVSDLNSAYALLVEPGKQKPEMESEQDPFGAFRISPGQAEKYEVEKADAGTAVFYIGTDRDGNGTFAGLFPSEHSGFVFWAYLENGIDPARDSSIYGNKKPMRKDLLREFVNHLEGWRDIEIYNLPKDAPLFAPPASDSGRWKFNPGLFQTYEQHCRVVLGIGGAV